MGSEPAAKDATTTESGHVALATDCVHTSQCYLIEHQSEIRGELLPWHTAIGCDLADMGECCHLDTGCCREVAQRHGGQRELRQQQFRPYGLGPGFVVPAAHRPRETPAAAAAAAVATAATAATSAKGGPAMSPGGPRQPSQLSVRNSGQREPGSTVDVRRSGPRPRLDTIGSRSGAEKGVRVKMSQETASRKSPAELEDVVKRYLQKLTRRVQRIFQLTEADARAVTEGVYEWCSRDIAETKRIVAALLEQQQQKQQMERRQEKRARSAVRVRPDKHSCLGPPESESGSGTSRQGSIIVVEEVDRQSKLFGRSKIEQEPEQNLVCCIEPHDPSEVARTEELQAIIVPLKPPDFELVKTWTFLEPPVRLLRHATS